MHSQQKERMYQSVADYYTGKSVFITGGTGFIGKVLIEKLLYSCPGINKIYLLVREQTDVNAQQRIDKLLDQPIFSRLKDKSPQALQKIKPIVGDIIENKLGIKAEDEQLLIETVSIVFHLAATIKFNEPLDVAMKVNVTGTEQLLKLSQRMKNIKVFVHVSTAYSNPDRDLIEEVLYPPPVALNEVNKLLELGIDEEEVKHLIKGWPNTYVFTKSLAENLVAEYNHGNTPFVIIRPSVVSASKDEPIAGWIDNWFGATGLITSIAKGLNRVLLANPENKLDLIPVDYVSNLAIVAASKCKCSEKVAVFNCSTSGENPITLQYLFKLLKNDSYKHKFYDVPMPSLFFTQYKWIVFIMTLILQIFPAYLADIFLLIRGKKTRYVKLQARLRCARDMLEHFTSHSYTIRATNTIALYKSLSTSDKPQFPCNPTDIKWDEYVPSYCQGIRNFLSKR